MRLFVALELPEEVKQAAAGVTAQLKATGADVKWVATANLHLTLKFLGEVAEGLLPELRQALGAALAGHTALELVLRGCGAFPSPQRPQVVWLGLEGQVSQLASLAAGLESACQPLGFAPEGRAFQAHLTLGRLRRGKGPARPVAPLVRGLAGLRHWEGPAFRGSRVALIQSTLTPGGPRYQDLTVWELPAAQ